jgi:hypothetical protein
MFAVISRTSKLKGLLDGL